MVVLLPLFWLQSSRTFPVRIAFFMSLTTRSGWAASSERASSRASADAAALVRLPSRPA